MKQQGALSRQFEAYHLWKKDLIRQMGHYQVWLQSNDLFFSGYGQRYDVMEGAYRHPGSRCEPGAT